jgi:hypothetical protein
MPGLIRHPDVDALDPGSEAGVTAALPRKDYRKLAKMSIVFICLVIKPPQIPSETTAGKGDLLDANGI